jgi:hypothetical protein
MAEVEVPMRDAACLMRERMSGLKRTGIAMVVSVFILMFSIVVISTTLVNKNLDIFFCRNTIGLMKDDQPVSVRLPLDIIDRLDRAAKTIGLGNRTALIKMSVAGFLEHFEKSGSAGLPLNWKEIVHDLDGRSHRYDYLKVAEKTARYGKTKNSNGGGKEK